MPLSDPNTLLARGLRLHFEGQLEQAEQLYRELLEQDPDSPQGLHLMAVLMSATGRHAEAAQSMARSTAAYRALLEQLFEQGQAEQATELKDELRALQAAHAEVYNNWGVALQQQQRWDEAVQALERAVAIRPGYPQAHANLGSVLFEAGQLKPARVALERALTRAPELVQARHALGLVLAALGLSSEAEAALRQALELQPDDAGTYNALGTVLQDQGRIAAAAAAFERALELDPQQAHANSNLVFLLTYHQHGDSQQIYDQCREFYRRQGQAVVPRTPRFELQRDAHRRLRVGYLSSDLRDHVIASNFEPLLAGHDSEAVEVYCYANVARPDAVTERIKQRAQGFCSIVELSDEDAAAQMRRDRIDVLVDLGWHTADNRLPLLARRPAPVQVSYLGALASTGFDPVDYWITDHHVHPADTTEPHCEQLYRLDRCFACYSAPRAGEVLLPPPDRPVTFGSFNTTWKLKQPVVELWARVLAAVPGSRLLLKARQLSDATRRQQLTAQFAAAGLDAGRLDLRGEVPLDQHYALYGELDVALDPFPFNGGVTSFEALWMGVPLVTLAGDRFISRMGLSMLEALGRPQWIAQTPEAYVEVAAALALDPQQRRRLRADQRQRVADSPLCDGVGLARALERAYRWMWTRWLES